MGNNPLTKELPELTASSEFPFARKETESYFRMKVIASVQTEQYIDLPVPPNQTH